MAHQTLATLLIQQMSVLGDEPGNLGQNSRAQQFLRTALDHLSQRVM